MSRWLIASFVICVSLPALGGKFNSELSIGDQAPRWAELRSTTGESFSIDDFKQSDVLVLAFTSNTCPYAVDYEERMAAFAKKFENRSVAFVVINCNAGDKDSLRAMQDRAAQKKFPFLYAKDEAGSVGKEYGALRTPEFVVLDRDRKVVYLGAMDDDPQGKAVKRDYLTLAVEAALAGMLPDVTETPPIGCAIKYPREGSRSR